MNRGKFQFIKENSQIVYGLILMIFIPTAVIFNTLAVIKIFQQVVDREFYDKALTIGQVISVGTLQVLDKPMELEERLRSISEKNSDIALAEVSVPDGDNFKIIASTNETQVGQDSKNLENVIAWQQDEPIAYLASDKGELLQMIGGRYWSIIMPIVDGKGEKQAILSLKVSSGVIDALTQQILWQSYIILGVIVLIIILLLSNNTKIFEYLSLYRKLQEVDKMKDEFISIASHELRAPITGVSGYISMIQEGTYGEVPEKLKEPLRIVEGAAARLAALVEDLLNVSRIEQGRLMVNLKPTNINPLIVEAIGELQSSAKVKNLELIFKTPDSVLNEANVDPERFVQVMTNLISNGIKYTEQGSVEVFTEMKNDKVVVKIKDSGIGMSNNDKNKLFSKFYRIQNEKTRGIIGTGLGLWLTKNIVDMMKGQIVINSIEGFGTQVVLTFGTVKKSVVV